jgi:hypothetical protein
MGFIAKKIGDEKRAETSLNQRPRCDRVLWRFRFRFDEARTARIARALLFGLAGFFELTSVPNFLDYRAAQCDWNWHFAGRRVCDALARQSETALGSHYFERRLEG